MDCYLPILHKILEKCVANSKEIDWSCSEMETLLFYTMRGFKPVGVNRHFMMICIHNKFSTLIEREISSKNIWDYLDSLYDMAALHESEIIPFPNDEVDYDLPAGYRDLMSDKLGVSLNDRDEENEDSKSDLNSKTVKKSISKSKQNGTPISTPKNNHNSTSGKSSKQSFGKNETKPPVNVETSAKKVDSLSTKLNKVKRSSSPFTTKTVKTEQQTSASKDESFDSPVAKKVKLESSTPVSSKKTPKVESNSTSKKSVKQDSSSKQSKTETETPVKKVRNDKDVGSKKSKSSTPSESSSNKKNSKVESRKSDLETSKRTSDVTSGKSKSDRNSSKGTKYGNRDQEDSDSSLASGSRKSYSSGKADDKKKKKSSPLKRKRI